MLEAKFIKVGRTPRIEGSRITVFDVLDYLQEGWDPMEIALFFRLSTRQVDTAVRYIEEHHDEVMADYQRILDRDARGNLPVLQARLDDGRERFLPWPRRGARRGPRRPEMRGILADINVAGILTHLGHIGRSETWREIWIELGLAIETFESLGLPLNAPDDVIWRI